MEYPGYGICPGAPCTSEKVTANAFTVFSFILDHIQWPLDSIMIFGRSVGTAPAVHLATEYAVAGLILVAPFLSVRKLANDHVGALSKFVDERFPTDQRAPLIQAPVLIIHGRADAVIPVCHSIELIKLVQTRKLLISPVLMGHNGNLLEDPATLTLPMFQFFSLPDYGFEDIQVPQWAYRNACSLAHRGRFKIRQVSLPVAVPSGDSEALESGSVGDEMIA